ncbi:Uncharacterised protein [uncultured archaeon]|nr:Uncharacterised protein [uncultured archaeon]
MDASRPDFALLRRVCDKHKLSPSNVLTEWKSSRGTDLNQFLADGLAHGPKFVGGVLNRIATVSGEPAASADYEGVKRVAAKRRMRPKTLLRAWRQSGLTNLDQSLRYCNVANPRSVNRALTLAREHDADADLDATLDAHARFGVPIRDGLSITRIGAGFNPPIMKQMHALRIALQPRQNPRRIDRTYAFIRTFLPYAEVTADHAPREQPFVGPLWLAHRDHHVPLDTLTDYVANGAPLTVPAITLYHRSTQTDVGVPIVPSHVADALRFSGGRATVADVHRLALTQAALRHALSARGLNPDVHPLFAYAIQKHLKGDKLNTFLDNPAVVSEPETHAPPHVARTFKSPGLLFGLNTHVEIAARNAGITPPRGIISLIQDLTRPRLTQAPARTRFRYKPPVRTKTPAPAAVDLATVPTKDGHRHLDLGALPPRVNAEYAQIILFHGLEMFKGRLDNHMHIEKTVKNIVGEADFDSKAFHRTLNYLVTSGAVLNLPGGVEPLYALNMAHYQKGGEAGRIVTNAFNYMRRWSSAKGLPFTASNGSHGSNGSKPNGKPAGNGGANGK